jgi:flagellar biosynthesis/type III secretory pathway protein FliH
MARVIKAGENKDGAARRPGPRLGAPAGPKRAVIEKEVYRAQIRAAETHQEAEAERERILHEGKRQAAQRREEAQSEGAAEAFAEAAAEALTAFRRRAERYGEAADDIRCLALEVVHKILGQPPKLSERAVDAIVERGMNRLRARRKLRLQLPESRLLDVNTERPALVAAIRREPDILLEPVLDVSVGFCRVLSEVGGALCSEQAALDALAESVDVNEQALAPAPKRSPRAIADDHDDDQTDAVPREPGPSSPRPAAHRAQPLRGGVGLNVTAPDIQVARLDQIQVGGRARPLTDARDPEATMNLDVSELRYELEPEDDELDLHVDDSLPER